jgi:uncharacterized protein (TIGR00290 family)
VNFPNPPGPLEAASGASGAVDSRAPILLAWSGGKDSALALEVLLASNEWRIAALLTTVTEEYDRVSMHGVRTALLRAQASALALPLRIVSIPPATSNETYELRMGQALEEARREGVRAVAFGDLFLADVRAYRERMLGTVGMSGVFPLWGAPTSELARHFIDSGHRAVLTCVDTEQIDGRFAGREYDAALLDELPPHADPCGEKGEFHTFVYDGPCFREPVSWSRGERVLRENRFQYCDLL